MTAENASDAAANGAPAANGEAAITVGGLALLLQVIVLIVN